MTTTIILIRHGQTAWNKEERFRGLTDLPLEDLGLRQAEALGEHIATNYQPELILASPLQRALQTAEPASRRLHLAVQPSAELLDLNYGAFAGLSPPEAEARYPDLYAAWFSQPAAVCFPEGEGLADVRERVLRLMHSLEQPRPDRQVVLVTHLSVCRVALCALMGLDNNAFWRFAVDTASVSVLRQGRQGATLVRANDTCHLRGLA